MLVYYVVGLLAVVPLLLDQALRRRHVHRTVFSEGDGIGSKIRVSPVALAMVAVLLVCFSGLRYLVGTDYFLYQTLFAQIDSESFSSSLERVPQEPGFVALMFWTVAVFDHPYALYWVAAVLTVVPVLVAIWRKSTNIAASVFVYIFLGAYVVSFNAIRQSIAVAIMLLADTYRDRNRAVWVLLGILATLIHVSALVAFVVQLFASRWTPTWRSVGLILGITAAISFVLFDSDLLSQVAAPLNERYVTYLDESGGGVGTLLTAISRIGLLLLLMGSVDSESTKRYLVYAVASCTIMVLALSNQLIARIDPYFSIFFVLLIPNALHLEGRPRWKVVATYCALALYFGFFVSNYNDVVPYITIPEFQPF